MIVEHRTSNVQHSAAMKGMNPSTSRDKYDLEERLLDYSASIVGLVERLPKTLTGNHVASQLLRCGTSPFPNHGEAQAAESARDFVHKFSICLKELRESFRWLKLIKRVPLIEPVAKVDPLLKETEELIKIFAASIRTAKQRRIEGTQSARATL